MAQTCGPLLGGLLIRVAGAPFALLVDAASFVASSLLLRSIRIEETPRREGAAPRRHLRLEIRRGRRWVYRHEYARADGRLTHVWFFFNAIATTVFVPFAVRDLGIDALGLGVAYACAGSARCSAARWPDGGRRLGVGGATIAAQFVLTVAFVPIVAATAGALGLVLVCAGQLLFGVGIGAWQPTGPGLSADRDPRDRLQGRMNATIRSLDLGDDRHRRSAGRGWATSWAIVPRSGCHRRRGTERRRPAAAPFRRATMPAERA